MNKGLTEQKIREYNWKDRWIGCDDDLSIDFLRQMKDKLDWEDCISTHQRLSQKVIEEFKDYVNWWKICLHQNISYDFMEKHWDKIEWAALANVYRFDSDFQKRFKPYIKICFEMRGMSEQKF